MGLALSAADVGPHIARHLGLYDRTAAVAALAALPIAVWEFSLGVYLVAAGFRPAAVATLSPAR